VAGRLRRLLVYSGVSGLDLDPLASRLARELGAGHAKYEAIVEERMKAPIYHVAELLLANYHGVAEELRRAFWDMVEEASREEDAIVTMHLVYYRRHNPIMNPALVELHRLAARGVEVSIVDMVDDYYHIVYRIAERVARGETPGVTGFQVLDPASLVSWRSAHNSASQLLLMHGVKVYSYALKHTWTGHMRLASMLLGRTPEGGGRYDTVYISHPISKVRARAAAEGAELWSYPDAVEIEEFKRMLEEQCPRLVVLSPTSVDELIPGDGALATRIGRENRWPHPGNGVHEFPYPVDLAAKPPAELIYPASDTVANPGYMKMLRALVEASIERRDLSYVAQADYIVAYRPSMYGERHYGVDMEVNKAVNMGKPVYSVVPPGEEPGYRLFTFMYMLRSPEELIRALRCP